jgi:hypothetical protein
MNAYATGPLGERTANRPVNRFSTASEPQKHAVTDVHRPPIME